MIQINLPVWIIKKSMKTMDNNAAYVKIESKESAKYKLESPGRQLLGFNSDQSDRFFLKKRTPNITQLWKDKDNKKELLISLLMNTSNQFFIIMNQFIFNEFFLFIDIFYLTQKHLSFS